MAMKAPSTLSFCNSHLLEWTPDSSIPFLRVQANLDSLTQKEECPKDQIPDKALSLIMEDEVKDHWANTLKIRGG